MESYFVRKAVEIKAPAPKVWQVLTDPNFIRHWVHEFGLEGGGIESDWEIGSTVLWKNAEGRVIVGGGVTRSEIYKLLHYTVIDIEYGQPPGSDYSDGITYELTEFLGWTKLSIEQGDFAKDENYRSYIDKATAVWDRVLPIVKMIAEDNQIYH